MAGMEVSSAGTGAAGAMTHGHIKADNDDVQVGMSGHVSSMGQVTDVGGGLLGHGNAWRWGNPDVSSMRCNTTSSSSCSKHIDIRYHFIRDHISSGDFSTTWVSTNANVADIMTKPLLDILFVKHRNSLGLVCIT